MKKTAKTRGADGRGGTGRFDSLKLRFMTPVMLLVMALLVFCEYRYNLDLLNSISDPETRPEVAEALSQRGKLLAAFGITWALFRNLAFGFRNVFAGFLFLASLTFGAYVALDTLYEKVIDRLPPNIKVMGYNLLLYRHDLLTGDLEDPDIPNVKEEPVDGKIFMGAFPMVLLDERFMVPAQAYVIRRADLKVEESLHLAEEKWPQYEKSMGEIQAGYEKYIAWSKKAAGDEMSEEWGVYALQMQKLDEAFERYRKALDMATRKADFSGEWNAYNAQMNGLRARHKEFVDGSHKVAQYAGGKHEAEAKNRFRAASGGLEPNARVSLAEFPSLLKRSSHGHKIHSGEKRVIAYGPDGSPILAGEIPYFLDRPRFEAWVAGRAAQALRSVDLPSNRVMTREQFLNWVKESPTSSGEHLKKHEARNYGPPEYPVFGRDIPYFMDRDEFTRWTGHKTREALLSYDMPPDPELGREGFLELLRKAKSKEGEQLRAAENRLLAALPDGTRLRVGDVPYFMDREAYLQWARDEVDRLKINLVPTEENIGEFTTINQSNAAVFVPPMAIVSSLTSALVNAISLLILLLSSALSALPATRKAGVFLGKSAVPLMLACFCALIFAMPSHVFRQGTEAWNLESRFHAEIGFAAQLWSRLSNVQKFFL
jgi:hypothetical protein